MKQVMNWEGFCDMVHRCTIERKPQPKDNIYIAAALQAFWNEPQIMAEKVQAFTFSGDIPDTDINDFTKFLQMLQYDEGWKRAFREVPVSTGRNSWKIYDISNGLTIRQVREGQRLRVEGLAGTSATITAAKYGGAIGWTDEVFRFRELAGMQEIAEIFRNKFWSHKADVHYNLINAAGIAGGTTAWQPSGTDTQLNRDLRTVDLGAYTIGNRLKDKGYTIGRYVLYLPESMRVRGTKMQRATNTQLPSGNANGSLIDSLTYPVDFIYTWSSYIAANTGILCIPGNKAQRADIAAPFVLSDQDILQLTYVQAIWSYYGAGIGDSEQFQRLQFA